MAIRSWGDPIRLCFSVREFTGGFRMYRRLLTLCIAIVVASLGVPVAAAADTGGTLASGGFQGVLAAGAHQNIGFSADLTSNGAVGYVSETIVAPGSLSMLRGNVVCLAVSGSVAAVGFLVLQSEGIFAQFLPVGSTFTLVVQDSDAGDTFAFTSAECATAVTTPPIFPIENGNIIVKS